MTERNNTNEKMNMETFKTIFKITLSKQFITIIKSKPENNQQFTYIDAKAMSATVRNIFMDQMNNVPPQIETILNITEAIFAPTEKQKEEHIRKIIGITGTATGIFSILNGIGTLLGWGNGVIVGITTFFKGVSLFNPLAAIAGGIGIAAIANYFAFTNNDTEKTYKYIKMLEYEILKVLPEIWTKMENKIEGI